MKKLFVVALAAFALISCAKDEAVDVAKSDVIGFTTSIGRGTRATITTENLQMVQIFANHNDEDTFMYNVHLTPSTDEEGTIKWIYNPVQYWPNSGEVDFYAIGAPSYNNGHWAGSVGVDTKRNKTNTGKKSGMMNFIHLDNDGDGEFKGVSDHTYAVNMGEKKKDTPVQMFLRHMMSQLVFQFRNTNPGLKVYVEDMRIVNLVNGGFYALPVETTSKDNASARGQWSVGQAFTVRGTTYTPSPVTYGVDINATSDNWIELPGDGTLIPYTDVMGASQVTDITGATYAEDGYVNVVPQTVIPWDCENDITNENGGAYFLIKAKMMHNQSCVWPRMPEGQAGADAGTDWVAVPFKFSDKTTTLEEGKRYVITFVFGEGGGFIPPTDDVKPGEPVLMPVEFSIEVEEYEREDFEYPLGEPTDMPEPTEDGVCTLTIPLRSNTYVTPLNPNSKSVPACAGSIIRNDSRRDDDSEMIVNGWKKSFVESDPHQLSMFFYAPGTGRLDMELVVSSSAGDAVLDIEVGGKSNRVEVAASGEEKTYVVGYYDIAQSGYVRVNVRPVSTTADCYPNIKAFRVGNKAINYAREKGDTYNEVIFADEEDRNIYEPHFIRRGPTSSFWWEDVPADAEYFYSEICVPEGNDIQGTYYVALQGDLFYMGLQPQASADKRCLLFSVWDGDTANGKFTTLVNRNSTVTSERYTHEGCGQQSSMRYNWQTNRTYAFLARVRPEIVDGKATGASIYTGYFRGDEGWMFIAEMRRDGVTKYVEKTCAFNENYNPELGWIPRTVKYPATWAYSNGEWHECLTARFYGDKVAQYWIRRDLCGGLDENGCLYLRSPGYIDQRTSLQARFTRKPTGVAPDIDFAALEQMAAKKYF
ncbi:MAG: DUF5077 domain-containing protein [Rikenellaceae bacterium]|nr:DUF5077 domain-containing protein [Rikenellaceae bacterium]